MPDLKPTHENGMNVKFDKVRLENRISDLSEHNRNV